MNAKTHSVVAAAIGVFSSLFTASAFAAAKSSRLICNGYAGTATLTNFQALVKLSQSSAYGFDYADCAANDGSDLWFADAAGNVIPHEVDTWNTSGDSFVWVKIPEVLPSTNANFPTAITMHWGDAAEKAAHPCTTTDTWTGYAGVWHMNANGATSETDATGNGLDGTPQGAASATDMTNAVGVVGTSRANRGTDSALHVPAYSSTLTSPASFTISGWWNLAAWISYPRFFQQDNDKWEVNVSKTFGDTYIQAIISGGVTTSWDNNTKNSAPRTASFVNNWLYLTVVFNGTTLEIYSNGSKKWTKTNATANAAYDGGFRIGNSSSLNRPWYGYYDEVRMYDGAVPADRIAADYDTMSNPTAFLIRAPEIVTAEWTGEADDGNGANAQNWICRDFGNDILPGVLPTNTTRILSCTLSENTDWQVLGFAPNLDADSSIDLNGRNLSVAGLAGLGVITNSASGDAAQLCVSNAEDVANTTVAIGGNLKFVKSGAGTFTSFKAQTYTGGTVIAAGTAQPPTRTAATDLTHTWDNFKAFGTGEIAVNVGGTFDVRGQYGYRNIVTLNGGTWMSTGYTGVDNTRNDHSCVWRLTDDSFISVSESGFIMGNPDDFLDLNGHTLTVSVADGKYFNSKFSYTENPGTVILEGAGFGISIYADSTILATNVDFRISARINLNGNSQFHMHDYIALNTNQMPIARSGSKLCVYGTFKPNTANNYFVGPEMQDNTTIDLAGMSGSWSSTSGASGLNSCKYVKFVNGAHVKILLGSRRIAKGEAIVTWNATSRPGNLDSLKFTGVFNNRTVTLAKKDDGLYMPPQGVVIIVK